MTEILEEEFNKFFGDLKITDTESGERIKF